MDSIRLYSKAKSVIGWPEGPSEVPPTQSNSSITQQAGEMSPLEESTETSVLPTTVKSLSGLDRLVLSSQLIHLWCMVYVCHHNAFHLVQNGVQFTQPSCQLLLLH